VPDAADALIWQNAQLAKLEPEATPETWAKLDEKRADLSRTAAVRAGKTAVTSQMVEIDDNATAISVLLADKEDTNSARLQQINGLLAHKLGAGTFKMTLADSDDPLVLRSLTSTSLSEGDYVNHCFASGVPVPPAWGDPLWKEEKNAAQSNVLSPDFLKVASGFGDATVYTYTSAGFPGSGFGRGLCIALPRRVPGTNIASAIGIICQGNNSSKACFWDTRAGSSVPVTPSSPIPIVGADFVGGFDLVANGQGMCSDCHAGENAFVVHPTSQLANPGFANLRAFEYVQPHLAASWLQDRRPGRDLDIPVVGSGQQSCTKSQCHTKTGAGGRFPRFRTYNGYCSTIMGVKQSDRTLTTGFGALRMTMPPEAPNGSAYSFHRDKIRNEFCYTPLPTPTRFEPTLTKAHDNFSLSGEVPLMGDFNNDGKRDLVTFTLGSSSQVWVAISNGNTFNGGTQWISSFGVTGDIPVVGDFTGDGRDDIAVVQINSTRQTIVARSNGSNAFVSPGLWGGRTLPGQVPLVGDFNYDGKDDLVVITKGTTNDALVHLSNGINGFGPAVLWSDFISPGAEIPLVGDFDGDGFEDIASFTRGSSGDVFVSRAILDGFNSPEKWHDQFCFGNELPRVADINGDGLDDILTFLRGTSGDVYVALSNGNGFVGTALKWHELFGQNQELPFAGDMDADGDADLVLFQQGPSNDVQRAKAVP
jgi:hypothetical protein